MMEEMEYNAINKLKSNGYSAFVFIESIKNIAVVGYTGTSSFTLFTFEENYDSTLNNEQKAVLKALMNHIGAKSYSGICKNLTLGLDPRIDGVRIKMSDQIKIDELLSEAATIHQKH